PLPRPPRSSTVRRAAAPPAAVSSHASKTPAGFAGEMIQKNRPAFGGAFGRLLVCGGASYCCYSVAWCPALRCSPCRSHAFFESVACLLHLSLGPLRPLLLLYKQWPCQRPRCPA